MKIRNKVKRYDSELKKYILSLLITGKVKSIEELRRRFSIGGKMTVQRWLKSMGRENLLREKELITLDEQFNQLYGEIDSLKNVILELKSRLQETEAA